jgi:hypothetical protein
MSEFGGKKSALEIGNRNRWVEDSHVGISIYQGFEIFSIQVEKNGGQR